MVGGGLWRWSHLGKGAEHLRGHLDGALPLPVVHDPGPQRGVGLGDDGLLQALTLAAQLRSEGSHVPSYN